MILGALLRLPGLDRESLWVDETIATNAGTRDSIFDVIDFETKVEVNPPLYHGVLWAWIKLLGAEEGSVRLLSALAGIATIVVVFAIARRLCTPRAGLLAALLTATSPLLVHYSQEARPYTLFALLAALSLWCLLLVLDQPNPRRLALWCLVSLAALATSYFAAFLLAVEAVWLLRARRAELRSAVPAVGAVAAGGLALLPLAIYQRRPNGPNVEFISSTSLGHRVRDVAHYFLKGTVSAPGTGLGLAATALVVGGVIFSLARSHPSSRSAAALPLAVGVGGIGLVIAFDLVGFPIVLYRYLLAFWLALAVALAVGLGSRRAGVPGVAVAVALAAVWIAINIGMFRDETYHRDNWRDALAPLGPRREPRVLVVAPGFATHVLFYYRRVGAPLPVAGARVREVALVGAFPPGEAPPRLPGAPAFELVEQKRYPTLVRIRYRAPRPTRVARRQVVPPGGSGDAAPFPLLQGRPG